MDNILISILLIIIGSLVGALTLYIINKLRVQNATVIANKIKEKAEKDAEKLKRDKLLELKEESFKLKQETDEEVKEKKKEVQELKELVENRERSLNKRDELLSEREKNLDLRDKDLLAKQKEALEKDAKMESILKEQIALLEKISGFSKEKARDLVMKKVEEITGIKVQHYVVFNTKILRKIVDEIGGVTVDVPINMDYDDPDQNLYIHLKKKVHKS